MNNRLTKAQIIAGARFRKTINIEGLGEIVIRPLTDAEWAEIEMATIEPLRAQIRDDETSVEQVVHKVNLHDLAVAQLKAARLIVRAGLSVDEEWTLEEVQALPAGIVHTLAREVNKLTGASTTYADLVPFREESRRDTNCGGLGIRTPASEDTG